MRHHFLNFFVTVCSESDGGMPITVRITFWHAKPYDGFLSFCFFFTHALTRFLRTVMNAVFLSVGSELKTICALQSYGGIYTHPFCFKNKREIMKGKGKPNRSSFFFCGRDSKSLRERFCILRPHTAFQQILAAHRRLSTLLFFRPQQYQHYCFLFFRFCRRANQDKRDIFSERTNK